MNGALMTFSVLVVEDEVLLRMEAVDMVEDAGFRAYEAGSADEAIRVLEQHPDIDVLFTDIDMPGSMDGLRLARYVSKRWPPITLIVTSGHVKVDVKQLPEAGLFLSKPYPPRQIMHVLSGLAASAQG